MNYDCKNMLRDDHEFATHHDPITHQLVLYTSRLHKNTHPANEYWLFWLCKSDVRSRCTGSTGKDVRKVEKK